MINFENLVIDEVSFGSLNKKIYTFVELQNLLNFFSNLSAISLIC